MQNLTNIISNVLRDFLPQHLVRIITPKLTEEIIEKYKGAKENEPIES